MIPYVVEYNFDTTDGLTFRDMLNKLEKLSIIDSQTWNQFRILRNDITHVYPDDDKLIDTLNEIYVKKDDLYGIYKNLKKSVD